MKTYLTFLSRNRLFTLVNVLGLSVSLMFVLLIGDMVVRELTVGQDAERAGIFLNRRPAVNATSGYLSSY